MEPWSKVLEKINKSTASEDIFRVFFNQRLQHAPNTCLTYKNSVHELPSCLFTNSFNIILASKPKNPVGLLSKIVLAFLFSPCVPRALPILSFLIYYHNIISWGVKVMKRFLLQFFRSPINVTPLDPHSFLGIPFSSALIHVYLIVRDKVLKP